VSKKCNDLLLYSVYLFKVYINVYMFYSLHIGNNDNITYNNHYYINYNSNGFVSHVQMTNYVSISHCYNMRWRRPQGKVYLIYLLAVNVSFRDRVAIISVCLLCLKTIGSNVSKRSSRELIIAKNKSIYNVLYR